MSALRSSSSLPATTKKRKFTETGAPAQKTQSSRKGKKAWRKNVDIDDIEAGIEGLREEERTTGGHVHQRTNNELFTIDVVGDEAARKRIQKEKKPLRFLQVLQQRSAVPAVYAQSSHRSSSSTSSSSKTKLTSAEKARLLQKARKNRKGALNSVLDPTESGSAAASIGIVERVSGGYDVWTSKDEEDEKLAKVVRMDTDEVVEYLVPNVKKPKVKAPTSLLPSRHISAAPIQTPHHGISYNPSFSAHQALLQEAHDIELKREAEVEAFRETKERMEGMKAIRPAEEAEGGWRGMRVDVPDGNEDESGDEGQEGEDEDEEVKKKKAQPPRKTRQQRTKAARLKAEKQALLQLSDRKRLSTSLLSVKSLSRSSSRTLAARSSALEARRAAVEEAKKRALVGRRVGKHVVKSGEVDVQVTDELSESLRGLKPEGNLFKDRFLSMQQRALVEPRERVLPRKKKIKFKEYEKHPWKRFT